ncbi:MAG TPA: histidine kinase dimerization/phospho-acceptor domain-containing protein, partial [Mycobacteriales bacterium]|nr:histidine kinase dimerization/phospho-acceptor domain-containing protein [Mycobacteriales bacterium]
MSDRGATPEAVAAAWELLPDAALALTSDGTIAVANRRAGDLVGVPAGDLVGQSVEAAFPLWQEPGRSWWSCDASARRLRSVTRAPERRLQLGTPGREVLLTARYLRGGPDRDQLERVVVLLRPASARDRADEADSELISTVAHELRSPLTSVKGFSATMLAKWDRFSDEQKRQMLEWINGD